MKSAGTPQSHLMTVLGLQDGFKGRQPRGTFTGDDASNERSLVMAIVVARNLGKEGWWKRI